MDSSIRWVRRVVTAGVVRRLAIEGLLAFTGGFTALLALGGDPLPVVILSALATQVVLILRVAISFRANPIDQRFLAEYLERIDRLNAVPEVDVDEAIADQLRRHRLLPFGSLVSAEFDDVHVTIHRDTHEMVLALLAPGEEMPTLVTLVEDGRMLVSAATFVPPAPGLIVNVVEPGSVRSMVTEHLAMLAVLSSQSAPPVPATIHTVVEFMRAEHRGWDLLGPWIGPFIAMGGRRRPHLLTVGIDPARLWTQSSSVVDRVDLVEVSIREPLRLVAANPTAETPSSAAPSFSFGQRKSTHAALQPPPVPSQAETMTPAA
ncbi:MAG: hypothetical protein ACR2P0_20680 [Acidimicrobiales bacterium]